MVKILDCSIRDGGHQNNWAFSDDYVFNLIEKLKSQNIDYCEIGYRNHTDKEGKGKFFFCDTKLLQKYTFNKGNLKIGIMADYKRISLGDFKNAQEDNVDFIRIACHPNDIKNSLIICEKLKQRGYNIFLQLMEIQNVLEEHYKILEEWNNKTILESIYIADSYSCVNPNKISSYFNKLRQIGFNKISFHAHNACGLALENTLKAIDCGAEIIDVSQEGIGGNLNFNDYKNCL